MDLKVICHVKIEGQNCNLEFEVKKYNLHASHYFHNILKGNEEQIEFTFSNKTFGQKVYTLYFSEFPSKNIKKIRLHRILKKQLYFNSYN